MAGDAGDEFAAETQQNASQMISFLMYRAGIKSGSGGTLESIFGEKSSPHNEKSLSQMLSDAFKGLLPTSAQDNSALQQFANTDKVLDKKGIKDLPNTVEILVDNNTDFEFMKDVLDRNGVEYTISHETAPDAVFSLDSRTYSEGTDITLFELPNRNIGPKASIHAPFSQTDHTLAKPDHPFTQLRDLDPEVLSLFSYFDRQSMIEKWALRGAIDELTRGDLLQEALGLGKPQHFQVGAKQNFIAEFTTVKWDPQARIIAEPLERMGVPFELNIVDDVAYFEIAEQNAAAFKAVADFHLSNETSRIRPTRFPNYDALEIVTKTPGSKTELIEVTVADQGAATLIKDEFSERGIPYESLTSRTTGESTFLVSKQELVNKAPELAVAQKEFAAAARKPKQTAATRIRQQEAERIFGNTINKPPSLIDESKVSANRKPTPARDQRIAKQSAQARYRAQTKKLSRSAVRTPRAEGNLK